MMFSGLTSLWTTTPRSASGAEGKRIARLKSHKPAALYSIHEGSRLPLPYEFSPNLTLRFFGDLHSEPIEKAR